jgi:NAD(P)-dependent dehydrogenase (short-subunit alcohol dehydrogenase family)
VRVTEFEGKTALVTGAARGIGRGSALAFARRGANVIVCDILDEPAQETVAQVQALGTKAHFVHTDVSDAASVHAAVQAAVGVFGRLDYAHNNAGVVAPAPLAELAEPDWQRVLAVNLTGVFLCLQAEIPHILKTRGAIVNTASIWGLAGCPGQAAYVASKYGVIGLTKTAAADYGAAGIRVNAVAPGPIQTPMTAEVPAEIISGIIGRTIQQRYGQPAEVGEAVTWLCSPGASYVNGAVLPVDGG